MKWFRNLRSHLIMRNFYLEAQVLVLRVQNISLLMCLRFLENRGWLKCSRCGYEAGDDAKSALSGLKDKP
jgi:hypothetical protein